MVYRVEGEVCSPKEKRVITGEEIQAQAKPETAEKSSSSPEDKMTKKKKRSSIFKFRSKAQEAETN